MNVLTFSKGGSGYVLIKITGNLFNTKTGIKGLDGQDLQVDSTFQKERRARLDGEVIQTPFYMGNAPISQIPIGYPSYGQIRDIKEDMDDSVPQLYAATGGLYEYKMMSDIIQEVNIGDKIYFKWRVTFNHKNLMAQSVGNGTPTWIFRCQYDNIYCKVTDGKITMIGSHVLIDPVKETWDEILHPTYYDIKGADGKYIPRPKSEWIQVKTAPGNKDRQGVVAEVGTPLKGEKCLLSKGDRILFKPNMKSLLTIEGKQYFVLRQDQIVCKIQNL